MSSTTLTASTKLIVLFFSVCFGINSHLFRCFPLCIVDIMVGVVTSSWSEGRMGELRKHALHEVSYSSVADKIFGTDM